MGVPADHRHNAGRHRIKVKFMPVMKHVDMPTHQLDQFRLR